MNENILAWNVPNWVTVILMASIAFFLIGLGLKFKQSKMSPSTSSVNTTAGTRQP